MEVPDFPLEGAIDECDPGTAGSVRFPTLLGLRQFEAGIQSSKKGGVMGTIVPFLRTGEHAFDPKDVAAMATALDDVCNILNLNSSARETVAVRIIDLAKAGERNSTWLRDRVLHEAGMAGRVGPSGQ